MRLALSGTTRLLLKTLRSVLLLGLLASCAGVAPQRDTVSPPLPPREFRAMWVATVANIDWPSRPGLSSAEQQQEIRKIVATAKRLRMNALILQVRPSADALYASALEPWTEYLTGEQGRAPAPFYDPLDTWTNEAHANGLELHAWVNPYRARHSTAKSLATATHIINTHPGVAKIYGDQYWLDPGEPVAAQRLLDVVRDVVRRYDVDGVHVDDYFYPYPVKAGADQPDIDFPDELSWSRYLDALAPSQPKPLRADWRRENINRLVKEMHAAIHAEKQWVKFGISPFGLGRPELRPDGIKGFSQYDKLYADVERWLSEGWLDYLAPQLYWPIAQAAQSFPVLLGYWSRANTKKRHLWPGMFTSRIDESDASWRPDEIRQQIGLLRRDAGASGHIHFSASALNQNRKGVADLLANDIYSDDALVPAMPWLRPVGATLLAAPAGRLRCPDVMNAGAVDICTLAIGPPVVAASKLAIWAKYGQQWKFMATLTSATAVDLAPALNGAALESVTISAIDRYGFEGLRATLSHSGK
jgi:uncharacterized lipoprotein YddW (UPF0748 family)